VETFTVPVQVSCRESGLAQTVDALVGGGNALAMMPSFLLYRLGIEPERTMHFRSEDGGRVEFPVGHAHFSAEGAEGSALVVFGPDGRYELGTNTLDALLMEPDPMSHRLVPAVEWLPTFLLIDESGN
jgi:hypothetical protein